MKNGHTNQYEIQNTKQETRIPWSTHTKEKLVIVICNDDWNTGLRWCPRKDVLLRRTNIKNLCNRSWPVSFLLVSNFNRFAGEHWSASSWAHVQTRTPWIFRGWQLQVWTAKAFQKWICSHYWGEDSGIIYLRTFLRFFLTSSQKSLRLTVGILIRFQMAKSCYIIVWIWFWMNEWMKVYILLSS